MCVKCVCCVYLSFMNNSVSKFQVCARTCVRVPMCACVRVCVSVCVCDVKL